MSIESNYINRTRKLALESDEYKNSPYKIGDRIHVDEDGNEYDCTIVDALMVEDAFFSLNPTRLVYFIKLNDGTERALSSLDTIKYKYN